MKYIETYREGERFMGIYLCKIKQSLRTKAGKTYYSLHLQDKTGIIDAKIWDINNGIEDFNSMDFIMVDGQVTSFQGSLQVNVNRVRRASEGEYDTAEYIPSTKKDITQMYEELTQMIATVKEPHLRELLESYFINDAEFVKGFKQHSAAKSVHHGFVGGLLEHTLSVTKMCDYFAKNYPVIDRDLLITAAIFHDIGKTAEISAFPRNEYTDDGQLLGHIFIGAEMIGTRAREISGFPPMLLSELQHCILAHHGELEYGSPKKPAIVEAMALNFADNADAKFQTITELFDNVGNTTEWLGFNRLLDSNVRKSSGSVHAERN